MKTPTHLQVLLRGDAALVKALAEATGVTRCAVRHWRRRSVPSPKRATVIIDIVERATGVRLGWPEIYPDEVDST